MSFGAPPTRDDGVDSDGRSDAATEPPSGLLGRLRYHLRTWSGRYVQMRIDAQRGLEK